VKTRSKKTFDDTDVQITALVERGCPPHLQRWPGQKEQTQRNKTVPGTFQGSLKKGTWNYYEGVAPAITNAFALNEKGEHTTHQEGKKNTKLDRYLKKSRRKEWGEEKKGP